MKERASSRKGREETYTASLLPVSQSSSSGCCGRICTDEKEDQAKERKERSCRAQNITDSQLLLLLLELESHEERLLPQALKLALL